MALPARDPDQVPCKKLRAAVKADVAWALAYGIVGSLVVLGAPADYEDFWCHEEGTGDVSQSCRLQLWTGFAVVGLGAIHAASAVSSRAQTCTDAP